MKNVVKVSISGLAFTLEEETCILLNNYLDQLKKYYARQQNGLEVVEGIEERIAELLRERMSTPEEVVSTDLIRQVIAIMGKPEDIEEEAADQGFSKQTQEPTVKRKLYRNPDNKVLGGVCSGLGAYFKNDPLLFRLLFVFLALFSSAGFGFIRFLFHPSGIFIGSGWVFITYIVLWMILPQANTVAQKCEMRGEKPDFSGIQDRVKKGMDNIEKGARNMSQSINQSMGRTTGGKVVDGVGRMLAVCVGIVMLLIALGGLTMIPLGMIMSVSWLDFLPSGIFSLIASGASICWIHVFGAIVLLLPFVGLLYGGLSLVFKLHPKKLRIGLILFLTWVAALITLLIMLALAARPYYGGVEHARENIDLSIPSDTLYIRWQLTSELPQEGAFMSLEASEAYLGWYEGRNETVKATVYPRIRIVRVDSTSTWSLRMKTAAAGRSPMQAQSRAEAGMANYILQDSLLTLMPSIYTPKQRWQGNDAGIVIYLPKGKEVVLIEPSRYHFDKNSGEVHIWDEKWDWKGKHWNGRHWRYRWDDWDDRWDD